ncbi:Hypothetical_protein [Hexamita inflata]|uniref:Hypothetical_protein n=1 Tax=Hexamita inflata TaxID=28002 RepID=A0AA86PKC0_9EUKA|nr:Hypothetical protein HINF_LOCUS24489 [Hexamita inflata]
MFLEHLASVLSDPHCFPEYVSAIIRMRIFLALHVYVQHILLQLEVKKYILKFGQQFQQLEPEPRQVQQSLWSPGLQQLIDLIPDIFMHVQVLVYIPLNFHLYLHKFRAHVFSGNLFRVGEAASQSLMEMSIQFCRFLTYWAGRDACFRTSSMFHISYRVLIFYRSISHCRLMSLRKQNVTFIERLQDQYQVGWRNYIIKY